MYIDDPQWKGPRCHFCGAPVKDAAEVASEDKQAELHNREPRYFCSDDCVRAKYIG